MNPQEKFLCSECDELHDDEDDAAYCCSPLISGVWLCGKCDLPHDSYQAAASCCLPEDPDSPEAVQKRHRELEAAGQQRLLP